MRLSTTLRDRSVQVKVDMAPAEPDVGIMSAYVDDFTPLRTRKLGRNSTGNWTMTSCENWQSKPTTPLGQGTDWIKFTFRYFL